MAVKRFVLITIRTNKQGQQLNVGKDGEEYLAIVNTMTMPAANPGSESGKKGVRPDRDDPISPRAGALVSANGRPL